MLARLSDLMFALILQIQYSWSFLFEDVATTLLVPNLYAAINFSAISASSFTASDYYMLLTQGRS